MKTKAIPTVIIALIGICIFTTIVSAETAEEWNEKGSIFMDYNEYEKALECFDKAIELDPHFAWAYNNRGVVYNWKGSHHRLPIHLEYRGFTP